jgi:trehalose-phosphatase
MKTETIIPRYIFSAPQLEDLIKIAPRLFLGLDYDGVLASIASRPEEAQPTTGIPELLVQLSHLPAVEIVIISGRTIADLSALLPIPRLTYIGVHGLTIRTASGESTSLLPPDAFAVELRHLRQETETMIIDQPGCFLENKGQVLALHYRLAPPETGEQVMQQFAAAVVEYQRKGCALDLIRGSKVVEVRPRDINKGKAIQLLLAREEQTTLPVYIGDDTTDEDAFIALQNRGVTVLVADPPRSTAARYYLKNPEEVRRFLSRVLEVRRTTATIH